MIKQSLPLSDKANPFLICKYPDNHLKTTSIVCKTIPRSNRVADGVSSRSVEDSVGDSSAARQTLLGDEVSGQTGDVGRG